MTLKNRNRILAYFCGSIIFLLLPVVSSPDFNWSLDLFSVRPFLRNFITYLLLLAFFYMQTFIFLPKFYFQKRYVAFAISMVLGFLVCCFGPLLIFPRGVMHHDFHARGLPPPSRDHRAFFMLTQNLFQFLVMAIFSYTLHINAQKKRAERARVEAELAYLKAQINPHFLFNTLNSIYSLAIQKSDATADAVVQLSSMMRYVLTEASKDFVALQKEVDYISDYIELQKTRLSKKVSFRFIIEGTPGYSMIAPMLLIPFVENTFKYGVNPDENCEISITISISEKALTLQTYNKKIKLRSVHEQSNKMGIENVRKRLLNLYPGKHHLQITEDELSFSVALNIELT